MHVVPVSLLLLLFPECYPARSFLHSRGFASVGVFLRCFAAAVTRTWLYVGFLGHMEARKARCASCHDLEVCVRVRPSAFARLWTTAHFQISPHILVGCASASCCSLCPPCAADTEVGRGAGCGRLAGRQNLRGNKTTVCV